MEGVIVRVSKNGKMLREYKYPSNLRKEFQSGE